MRTRPWVIRCHNLTLSNKNSSTFTAPSSLPLSRFILLPHSTDFRAHAFLHSLKSTAACKISTHICSDISYSQRKWCSLVEITCKELSTNMVSVQMNIGGMNQDPKEKNPVSLGSRPFYTRTSCSQSADDTTRHVQ